MSSKPALAAALVALCLGRSLAAAQGPAREAEPTLVLQLDFVEVAGTEVRDDSGHGYNATLEHARVVTDRKRIAVRLDGSGQVSLAGGAPPLPVHQRSLTVGARCKPDAPDGVIVSIGDTTDGFSLYLRGGIPHFAVRSNGTLYTAVASGPVELNTWSHIAGVIGPRGELTLVVDTMPDGTARGVPLGHAPAEPLSIGADPGSPVGDYSGPMRWNGLLSDARLYWGEVSRSNAAAVLGDWADRPMCGTR